MGPRALAMMFILMLVPTGAGLPLDLTPLDDDAGSGGDAGNDLETALPIVPGSYAGTLMRGFDPWDYYAFEIAERDGVRLVASGDVSAPFLYAHGTDGAQIAMETDTEGFVVPTTREGLFAASVPGRYVMQLNWGYYDQYRFSLEVTPRAPPDDVGSGRDAGDTPETRLLLPEGSGSALLDDWDTSDRYVFSANAGERGAIILEGNVSGSVEVLGNDSGWLGGTHVDWYVSTDALLEVRVTREQFGEAPYSISLVRATDGEYVSHVVDQSGIGTMAEDSDRLLFTKASGVHRLDLAHDISLVDASISDAAGLARDASGTLYATTYDELRTVTGQIERVDASGEHTMVYPGYGEIAFGPDGGLYFAHRDGVARTLDGTSYTIVASDADASEVTFCPDGSAWVITDDRDQLLHFSPGFATRTIVGNWSGHYGQYSFSGLACDQQGAAITTRDSAVWRYAVGADPVILGYFEDASQVYGLALMGDWAYVAVGVLGSGPAPYIGRIPMPSSPFDGHHPAFALGPTVDFRMQDVRVIEGGLLEPAILQGTILNLGELSFTGYLDMAWFRDGGASTTTQPVNVDLPPGASVLFETEVSGGDDWVIWVDYYNEVYERDEEDNANISS